MTFTKRQENDLKALLLGNKNTQSQIHDCFHNINVSSGDNELATCTFNTPENRQTSSINVSNDKVANSYFGKDVHCDGKFSSLS